MRILWANLKNKTKLFLAGLSAVIVASGATLGVMAAIPDSNTGLITACRNNSNGGLKVIDAQAGASCGGSETLLSWPSTVQQVSVPQTAIARIKADVSGSGQGTLDTASSRNITSFKSIIPPPKEALSDFA